MNASVASSRSCITRSAGFKQHSFTRPLDTVEAEAIRDWCGDMIAEVETQRTLVRKQLILK